MRLVLAAASLLALLVACSSSTDGEDCAIVGTYSVLGTIESGNCPDPGSDPVTYTITPRGSVFAVEIQGLAGACAAEQVGTCKVQGKCDLGITDARDPSARGTFQFAWTFTESGFSGVASVSIPDAVSLPGGCSGTVKHTASRR